MRSRIAAVALALSLSSGPAWALIGDDISAHCSFVNTGDVENVTINIDCARAIADLQPLLDDLEEASQRAEELSHQLGVTEGMLQSALLIVGEREVPTEKRAERIVEAILRQRDQIERLRAETGDEDSDLRPLRLAAADAIEEGDLRRADDVLAGLEEREEALELETRMLEAASTRAERGEIAITQLRYIDAADHFAAAALKVPRESEETYIGYLRREASALYFQGDEFGDNAALATAINRRKVILERQNRERVPLNWATTQNNLGTALSTLGERESGTARLEEAVAAYRLALEERTRERVPLDWATTQNNLGTALVRLGERESGTARLEEAVAAYRAALEEWTRERVPLDWAMTQNNLGTALSTLGERESGTARLEEAVAAYRLALEERTRERVPLNWARTQNNLGTALSTLGERESGTARLEEAVAAYRLALEERTRERVPFNWDTTQNNLGTALVRLGERESGTARLEEAVAAYRAALEEWTRERVPLNWARTQSNLGNVLVRLGERTSNVRMLKGALEPTQNAYDVFVKEAGQTQFEGYFAGRMSAIRKKITELEFR